MSKTSREWSDFEKSIEEDDPNYGKNMRKVGKWAKQKRDKSKVTPSDKWERASRKAERKGKRQRKKIDINDHYDDDY